MRPTVPPPVIGLATAFAMWWTAGQMTAGQLSFPGQTIVAAALALAGLALDVVSVLAFLKVRTTVNPLRPERSDTLVVEGFYRVSRNPMYLGMLLILSGIAVYLGQLANVGFLVLFVALINTLQIKPEERALAARFGVDYDDYRRRVRRWL